MTVAHIARAAALSLGFMIPLIPAHSAPRPHQEPKPATCCFDRQGFPGICRVQPAPGESCESILEYLNTPGAMGKTYCGGSRLRGGWELVDCNSQNPPPSENR